MVAKSKSDTMATNIEKSKRLIGLIEFLHSTDLRREMQAGFKAYTKDKKYRSRTEWKEKLSEYKNRDLKEG